MSALRVFLVLTTLVLAANALDSGCFKARMYCFDEWARKKDCGAADTYRDCMKLLKIRRLCNNDTATVEDAYDASVDCGLIPRRKDHNFPASKNELIPRFIDSDGTKMYEFHYDKRSTYTDASKYCYSNGGSLFIPRHHYNIISLEAFLRRYIKVDLMYDMYYTGPNKNNGDYKIQSWGNDGHKFWVGANDRETEGEFRFEDGSTLLWDFFANKEGPHDTGFFGGLRRRSDDCVTMDLGTLHGYVRNCDDRRPFVCQYRGSPEY